MVNLENKLTVDDLIVEYMMYKVKNRYEPSFLANEFIDFLSCFELKKPVLDALYDGEELFKRFFERKAISDWNICGNLAPHMEMIYSEQDNDYLIKAANKLSDYDSSVITTYFMHSKEVDEIRNIIKEYLEEQPKRKIDESVEIWKYDLMTGKCVAAEIIENIWQTHINKLIEDRRWPRQCKDINKYMLDTDLAEIIGVKSIKNELMDLYKVFSKRIAIMYHQDRNLKISTSTSSYLPKSNYDLLIEGYEELMKTTFGPWKSHFEIDFAAFKCKESHAIDGVYYFDEDPDIKTTISVIGNAKSKKLVKQLDNIKG
ncbi:MAG: hypothetical protein E7170_01405 [Firmicutes bacterium]|nr:hypothetical protein [Bacillota bacterium]